MNTLLRKAAHAPASYATPALSPSRVLDAPLDVLLAELAVEVIDSSITDAGFFGAVVQCKTGEMYLTMPSGRSELEHDTVARYLIAQAFRVDLPQLPEPFETTVM
ncbi:hypothetical protein [Streptomyces sp. NPDC088794]|uniref:hypothetical protein n=1 Tax=Streptomyces sp. NPDC088794 TaxID=3365902 RepID=UPI00382FE69D